jgi:hypothetical protein
MVLWRHFIVGNHCRLTKKAEPRRACERPTM